MSLLASGQKIITKYSDTLLQDNFNGIQNNFPQKYNAFELLIIENSTYRIKRISAQSSSFALDKSLEAIDEFEMIASLELTKSKNKQRLHSSR